MPQESATPHMTPEHEKNNSSPIISGSQRKGHTLKCKLHISYVHCLSKTSHERVIKQCPFGNHQPLAIFLASMAFRSKAEFENVW
ncbi:hypothetical protein Peur_041283 [Populus x canadensis]